MLQAWPWWRTSGAAADLGNEIIGRKPLRLSMTTNYEADMSRAASTLSAFSLVRCLFYIRTARPERQLSRSCRRTIRPVYRSQRVAGASPHDPLQWRLLPPKPVSRSKTPSNDLPSPSRRTTSGYFMTLDWKMSVMRLCVLSGSFAPAACRKTWPGSSRSFRA